MDNHVNCRMGAVGQICALLDEYLNGQRDKWIMPEKIDKWIVMWIAKCWIDGLVCDWLYIQRDG